MRVVALAVAAAVAFATPVVAISAVHRGEGRVSLPRPTVEQVLPQLERFVERTRGLRYKRPVRVSLLSDRAFRARLRRDAGTGRAEVERASLTLRALGLLGPGVDLAGAVDSLFGNQVAGFYDDRTGQLVVRGTEVTPFVRETLVHELTHALQDQWFRLHRPRLDAADDETGLAFSALVEGDAVRVEEAYLRTLSSRERREAVAQDAAPDTPGVPDVVAELLAFPYQVGPPFVGYLVRTGGQARLDRAFASPPTTSEQLLDPARFVRGEGARRVAAPMAGGRVVDRGVIGQLGLILLFQREAETVGWGGDRYVSWGQRGRSCTRARIVMDDADATRRLVRALSRWARNQPDARVTGAGPVTLTACR